MTFYLLTVELCIVTGCSVTGLGVGGSDTRYADVTDQGFEIAAVPLEKIASKYLRQRVLYNSSYAPGTIVVDPGRRLLYLVEQGGWATRYGISVGVGAFAWSGDAFVGRKVEWPVWTPPREMVERAPSLAQYEKGLKPGSFNPLGARALYLYENGNDTLYRLHGTSEWWSIGKAASSGCIRLLNQDIIDLYRRVDVGTRVIVLAERPNIEFRQP